MNRNGQKPNLIIIEGPAGVGKTTMQKYLHDTLALKNIIVDTLPEFSNSKLGRLIEKHSHYGHDNPDWLMGINGLMLFLNDKVNVIEMAESDSEKIWICDRFISTQFILGLKAISSNEDRLYAKEITQKIFDWSLEKISGQSIFIFLDSSIDILQKRLENRICRVLMQQELKDLKYEINGYRRLANSLEAKNTFLVEGNCSINHVGSKILKLIYSVWQQ